MSGKKVKKVNLAEALGHGRNARLVIVGFDEFGECHAANKAIIALLDKGVLKTAEIAMTGNRAKEAVDYALTHPDGDFGVHLALTSKDRDYNMKLITPQNEAPGLYAPDGYAWGYGDDLWKHATAEEIKMECRAQIEKAYELGLDPTHLSWHDGLLNYRFLTVAQWEAGLRLYAELGQEYGLPMRYLRFQPELDGDPEHVRLRKMVEGYGVLLNDEWGEGWRVPPLADAKRPGTEFWVMRFKMIAPGNLMEIWSHPIDPSAPIEITMEESPFAQRIRDYEYYMNETEVRAAIEEGVVKVIRWKQVRELQRRLTNWSERRQRVKR